MTSITVRYGNLVKVFENDISEADTLNALLPKILSEFELSNDRKWSLKAEDGSKIDLATPVDHVASSTLQLSALPRAFVPSNTISIPKEDTDYDLTTEHAMKYQSILSKKAGNSNGPLLTKNLREKREKPKPTPPLLYHCEIKARFPDRTFIHLQFTSEDTIGAVYESVKESLNDPERSFNLALSHPYLKLEDHKQSLKEASFDKKTLVVVEIQGSSPYLKSDLLKDAAPSESLLSQSLLTKNNPEETQATANSEFVPKPAKKMVKTPKWLKISKK